MIKLERVEITSMSFDKDSEVIYYGYTGFIADSELTIKSGFDVRGEEYMVAKQAVDAAITDAAMKLESGELVDTFAVIEDVIEAGARRRLGLDT